MAIVRRTVVATAMLGAGLASTTGTALATEHHGDDQHGAANFDHVQTHVPFNVCNNDVPVNVGGVQVPLQDVVGNIPILSGAKDHSGNTAGVHKSCGNGIKGANG